MEPEWPERIARGLRGLAEETPPHGHMERALAGARRKLQRGDGMRHGMQRVSVAGVGAFAVVVALLFVPVSYEMGIGSVVRAAWEAPADEAQASAASAAIAAEVQALDHLVDFNLKRMGDRMYLTAAFSDVDQETAGNQVRGTIQRHVSCALAAPLQAGPDGVAVRDEQAEISVASMAIVKLIRANALAAATGGLVRIHVQGSSPEEIGQALMAELEAQGFVGSSVDVRTESVGDSTHVMHVEVHVGTPPPGTAGDSTEIEMIITQEGE